jgi:hypothetical protein
MKRFIIGIEDLEDGMVIKAKDLDDARIKINEMIDVHEVDKDDNIID